MAEARRDLTEAEGSLTQALLEQARKQIAILFEKVEECRATIAEIPPQAALDHGAAKQATIKDLEECARRIQGLHKQIDKLSGEGG